MGIVNALRGGRDYWKQRAEKAEAERDEYKHRWEGSVMWVDELLRQLEEARQEVARVMVIITHYRI